MITYKKANKTSIEVFLDGNFIAKIVELLNGYHQYIPKGILNPKGWSDEYPTVKDCKESIEED